MKTKVVLLFGALALVMSSHTLAQGTGFYGGIGIGKSKARLNTADFTFNQTGVKESKDELDTAYTFFGGYQFAKYIAAELSYTDFGKFAYIYDTSGTGVGTGQERLNYKAKSWALSAVGLIPLGGSGFSAMGRLGVARNFAERSALTGDPAAIALTSPIPSATKQTTGLVWGVGGQYDFTPRLALRLEYEDFGKFGEGMSSRNAETGRAKIHMYSLSFIARF
jgi:opacity protein-like surface antigen